MEETQSPSATLRRYAQMAEYSLGLLCVHDLSGQILLVNEAAALFFEYPIDAMVGKNIRNLLAPSAQGLFSAYLDRIRNCRTDTGLMRIITRTGKQKFLFYQNRLWEDHGEERLVLGNGVDMTQVPRATSVRASSLNSSGQELVWGESPEIKHVLDMIILGASSDSPVLLHGETGTGKGVIAREIHQRSIRCTHPFVEINCSVAKQDLLSSELFGHVRGAFTSAYQSRRGLIGLANGGTLFLDEVGDMDLPTQAQFLKVLEEKRYRRIGEDRESNSEFRLICASNQDLMEKCRTNLFRKDLFFRIHVLPIEVPPLRARQEDIPALARSILRNMGLQSTKLDPEALQLLANHTWPGNVRELKNVLERAVLVAKGTDLTAEHFTHLAMVDTRGRTTLCRQSIDALLDEFGGDKKKVAKALGISLATLYRKLQRRH